MAFSPSHVQYCYAPSATIGTALGASSASTGLPLTDRPSINPGVKYAELMTARNSAFMHSGDVLVAEKAPSFAFSCPLSAYILADLAYALFQNVVSEGVSTPFTKVIAAAINTPKDIDRGDVVSGVGAPHALDFWQLHNGAAGTDDDFQLVSGVPSELTISMQNGVWSIQATFLGFDSDVKALDYTGTVTMGATMATAGRRYLAGMFVNIGATTLVNAQDISLTIRNGLAAFAYNKGVRQSMILASNGMSATLTMSVPYDIAETNSLITLGDPSATPYVAGVLTPTQTKFEIYGPNTSSLTATASDDIGITFRGHVALSEASSGSDQMLTKISANATWDGTNAPVSIALADASDRAWT